MSPLSCAGLAVMEAVTFPVVRLFISFTVFTPDTPKRFWSVTERLPEKFWMPESAAFKSDAVPLKLVAAPDRLILPDVAKLIDLSAAKSGESEIDTAPDSPETWSNAATRSAAAPEKLACFVALFRVMDPEVASFIAFKLARLKLSSPVTVIVASGATTLEAGDTKLASSCAAVPLTEIAPDNTTAPVVLPATALKSPTATAPVSVKFTE